jgi:myo-inositol-1(or 4)-monophosphatase
MRRPSDETRAVEPPDLADIAVDVAELAAALVRQSVGEATITGTKSSPTDVVTETDVAAEKLIRSELEQRCPGSSVIGEEFEDTLGSTGVGWIVDPIDGTVNFAYDLPVMSVSIAATIDGHVVAGAVSDVLRRETFSAFAGGGAHRDGFPIAAGRRDGLSTALVLTGFSYDAPLRGLQADVLTRVLPAVRDIRCMGSAALNLCWVACGRADAFYQSDLKVYDQAAGALIAVESGAESLAEPARTADGMVAVSAPGILTDLMDLVTGDLSQGPAQG